MTARERAKKVLEQYQMARMNNFPEEDHVDHFTENILAAEAAAWDRGCVAGLKKQREHLLAEFACALEVDATKRCPSCCGDTLPRASRCSRCEVCHGHGCISLTLDEIVDAGLAKERERTLAWIVRNAPHPDDERKK